jgi:hypothetical protein
MLKVHANFGLTFHFPLLIQFKLVFRFSHRFSEIQNLTMLKQILKVIQSNAINQMHKCDEKLKRFKNKSVFFTDQNSTDYDF